MKIGVILLCRFSSSRLPGKIFREMEGRPLIDFITERILSVVPKEDLIVATSVDPTDDVIAAYCQDRGLICHRGSLNDVALRFLEAGTKMNWDYAVRINGDNLFVATDVMQTLMAKARTGQYDFLSNTHNKTFPQGMSVEIVKLSFFREMYRKFSSKEDFEHVTYYLHRHDEGNKFYLDNTEYPGAGDLKFAIDEQKDFDLCQKIMARFSASHLDYTMPRILEIYKQIHE